jgi:rhodanese-related sulfurtransferase
MKKWLSRLGTNQRLAAIALMLGVIGVFARPMPGGAARIDAQDLAAELQHGGTVLPRELADWIIKGTTDFRIVDVRDEAAFAGYHIPGAENVPLAFLADAGIGRNEKVVVCADEGTPTAQAWFILKAMGFRHVYALGGGIAGWKRALSGEPAQAAAAAPKAEIQVPSLPSAGAKAPSPKKKKEGC